MASVICILDRYCDMCICYIARVNAKRSCLICDHLALDKCNVSHWVHTLININYVFQVYLMSTDNVHPVCYEISVNWVYPVYYEISFSWVYPVYYEISFNWVYPVYNYEKSLNWVYPVYYYEISFNWTYPVYYGISFN